MLRGRRGVLRSGRRGGRVVFVFVFMFMFGFAFVFAIT